MKKDLKTIIKNFVSTVYRKTGKETENELIKKINQQRLFIYAYFNFFLGAFLIAFPEALGKTILTGEYHKVIPTFLGNFPIGCFSIALMSVAFSVCFVFVAGLNYYVYKEGLEFMEVIIKERKRKC